LFFVTGIAATNPMNPKAKPRRSKLHIPGRPGAGLFMFNFGNTQAGFLAGYAVLVWY
jgi:hypothetical protein